MLRSICMFTHFYCLCHFWNNDDTLIQRSQSLAVGDFPLAGWLSAGQPPPAGLLGHHPLRVREHPQRLRLQAAFQVSRLLLQIGERVHIREVNACSSRRQIVSLFLNSHVFTSPHWYRRHSIYRQDVCQYAYVANENTFWITKCYFSDICTV